MSNIKQLLQDRSDLAAEARSIVDNPAEDGVMSAEQTEKFDAIEKRVGSVNGLIGAEQRLLEIERTIEPIQSSSIDPLEGSSSASGDPPQLFASFGEQLQAVKQAALDPRLTDGRLRAISGASEGVGADGGFLVGEDTSNELLRNLHDTGIVVSRVQRRQISATSNRLHIRAINETSRADGSRLGGIRVFRDGEGEAATPSKPAFKGIDFELKKLTGLYYATEELLMDTIALEQEVNSWFDEEFGFKLDDEIINGDGATQMLGILQADALVTVSKETGQAATTVVFENISKMWSRMYAPARANAVWLINQDVEPELDNLAVVVGTGGLPVYLPANTLSGSPFSTLKGRPVIPIEQAATLGTVGDIMLVNLNEYILAEKGGLQAATSIHVKFIEGETAFRFILRNDGKPRWNAALTPFTGTANTRSPFVALATRI